MKRLCPGLSLAGPAKSFLCTGEPVFGFCFSALGSL